MAHLAKRLQAVLPCDVIITPGYLLHLLVKDLY